MVVPPASGSTSFQTVKNLTGYSDLPNGLSFITGGSIAGLANDEEKEYKLKIMACIDNNCSDPTSVTINLKCII